MPKLPQLQRRTSVSASPIRANVRETTQTEQALAGLGDTLANIGVKMAAIEKQDADNNFQFKALNNLDKDLLNFEEEFRKQHDGKITGTDANGDPISLSASMREFANERLQQASELAPSGTAQQGFESRAVPLLRKSVVNANLKERTIKREQDQASVGEFTSETINQWLSVRPTIEDASAKALRAKEFINNSNNYYPEEKEKLNKNIDNQIANGYFAGMEKSARRAIMNGVDNDSSIDEALLELNNKESFAMKSLTPSQKSKLLDDFMSLKKRKNEVNLSDLNGEISDEITSASLGKSKEINRALFPKMDKAVKSGQWTKREGFVKLDNIFSAYALGDAKKSMALDNPTTREGNFREKFDQQLKIIHEKTGNQFNKNFNAANRERAIADGVNHSRSLLLELAKDPGGYGIRYDDNLKDLWTRGQTNPVLMQKAIKRSQEVQLSQGMPRHQLKILPKQYAKGLVGELEAESNVERKLNKFRVIKSQFGANYDRAISELVENGLDPSFQVIDLNNELLAQNTIGAINSMKETEKLLTSTQKKEVREAVAGNFKEYMDPILEANEFGGNDRQARMILKNAEALTMSRVLRGQSPGDAALLARQEFFEKYHEAGVTDLKLLIEKTIGGRPTNPTMINSFIEVWKQENSNLASFAGRDITIPSMETADILAQVNLIKDAVPRMNKDGSGFNLYVSVAGGSAPLTRKSDGSPIEISFLEASNPTDPEFRKKVEDEAKGFWGRLISPSEKKETELKGFR